MVQENLLHSFRDFILSHKLFEKGDKILLGISGGKDSVVLAHLLKCIGQRLRGEESERDEAFVRSLAKDWNLPLHIRNKDTKVFASENRLSIQVAARRLRYEFFEEVRKQLCVSGKPVWIATAHHANDSVETLLMNLFRGTGIDGLRGIPVRNGHIVRPLLFAFRNEIDAYAEQNNLQWVDDSSNEKEDYTRNFIRRSIIPAIETQVPSVTQNIFHSARVLNDVASLYHKQVDAMLGKIVKLENGVGKIAVMQIQQLPEAETILYEWIRPAGFTAAQVGEVMKLLHANNGSFVASDTHRIIRNRAWLLLAPLSPENVQLQIADKLPFEMKLPGGKILSVSAVKNFEAAGGIPILPPNEALLDASGIQLPLIIRRRKERDYFYPLGMPKKKKVARFLIDRKASAIDKENVWIVESNKRILWIAGYRIDDRFKVTPQTRSVVRMIIKDS
ncbi:MAG: tRNA lysidine(34) synthetase TilS [Chitinophagaceae bacterium]|nr:tRNA lysidine(34) synthetase TilS [Chitinophagaceae bacterium]